MTTEAQCVESLLAAADSLGESPSKEQYERLGLTPASATIVRVFGRWNDAKEAAGLQTSPSRGARTRPKPADVELSTDDSWEELTVDQRWHYRNVERNTQRTLERRAELRAWVYEYKLASDGCTRCDEGDPACLDFHHVESAGKTMNVSALVNYEPSEGRLRREIEKCVLLCANCHRKEHYRVPDGVVRKTEYARLTISQCSPVV